MFVGLFRCIVTIYFVTCIVAQVTCVETLSFPHQSQVTSSQDRADDHHDAHSHEHVDLVGKVNYFLTQSIVDLLQPSGVIQLNYEVRKHFVLKNVSFDLFRPPIVFVS